jgi:hypothetical protein
VGPPTTANPTGATLGNYGPAAGSSVINLVPSSATTEYNAAPDLDFYGTHRKTNNAVDAGAVEFAGGTTGSTSSATVSPNPLAFGNWATGTTSNVQNLTVTNTGTAALAGGSFTFGGGTPQPFARVTTGTFPTGAPNCGAGLAVGAACTIKMTFSPATAVAFSRTLTVTYTGATVTPAAVMLSGTGVAARAALSLAPNPLTITLTSLTGCTITFNPPPTCLTATGTVTLTNNAATGGSQVTVTNVATNGGSAFTYFFSNGAAAGTDTCTGAAIAPGASCSVAVRFTNVTSARGANRAGAVTFTDTGSGGSQSGALTGFATP